ncbi:hypothetical protein NKH77_45850 [Streptomyces sp. M19]
MRIHGYGRSNGLIGRQRTLNELERILLATRLVSVTGAGGVGKSVLTAHLAARAAARRWAVVGTADLAELGNPGLVPHWLARALRVEGDPRGPNSPRWPTRSAPAARSWWSTPATTWPSRRRGCCGGWWSTAGAARPGHQPEADGHPASLRVPPLSADAVATLFTTRARVLGVARLPEPELTDRICAALEGLPLAARIAAGHLGLGGEELLSYVLRPESLLDLIATEPGLPARHRTLYASLDWSLRLCTRRSGCCGRGPAPSGAASPCRTPNGRAPTTGCPRRRWRRRSPVSYGSRCSRGSRTRRARRPGGRRCSGCPGRPARTVTSG